MEKHFRPLTCTTHKQKSVFLGIKQVLRWPLQRNVFAGATKISPLPWNDWTVEITHRQSKRSEEMRSQAVQFAQRK